MMKETKDSQSNQGTYKPLGRCPILQRDGEADAQYLRRLKVMGYFGKWNR